MNAKQIITGVLLTGLLAVAPKSQAWISMSAPSSVSSGVQYQVSVSAEMADPSWSEPFPPWLVINLYRNGDYYTPVASTGQHTGIYAQLSQNFTDYGSQTVYYFAEYYDSNSDYEWTDRTVTIN